MTAVTKTEFEALTHDELVDFGSLLHDLTDAQWDHDSLCGGWKVRHVIGQICLGRELWRWQLPVKSARFGLNVAKASGALSFEYSEEHPPQQLLERFVVVSSPGKLGVAKLAPANEYCTDKIIHQPDVRRPLGLPRQIPPSGSSPPSRRSRRSAAS